MKKRIAKTIVYTMGIMLLTTIVVSTGHAKEKIKCDYIHDHHASICNKISQAVKDGDLYKAELLYLTLLESEDYTLPECKEDNSGAKNLIEELRKAERDKREKFRKAEKDKRERLRKAENDKRKADEKLQNKLKTAQLDKEVRSIPSNQLEKNLELYKSLLGLNPTDIRYRKKVAFYQAKILAAEKAKLINTINFKEALVVKSSSWYTNDWNTAKWTIKIKNNSTTSWKDIVIKVAYYGPSGTKIYNSIFGHTEYIIIPSGKSAIIAFKDIMCPEQAVRARAWIDKATLYY